MKNQLTDSEILDGVMRHDDRTLSHVYKEWLPAVIKIVGNNGGSVDEAQDVFQDSIIALYNNVRRDRYTAGQAKLSTYFLQIAKYRWLDIRKSARVKTTSSMVDGMEYGSEESIEKGIEEAEKYQALHQLIGKLGEQCQQILKLFYWEKMKIEKIAEQLKMGSASVKNGKYRCMNQLKDFAANANLIKLM